MLLPSIFGENLLDDWMDFSFPRMNTSLFNSGMTNAMKTDVKETEQGYELDVDLPGFKKEDLKLELTNGYLTIHATRNENNDEKDNEGKYVRRERYSGSMSRSFYIGENITEEDIKAKFEDGILKMSIPKNEAKKVDEKKYIAIGE